LSEEEIFRGSFFFFDHRRFFNLALSPFPNIASCGIKAHVLDVPFFFSSLPLMFYVLFLAITALPAVQPLALA